MEEKRDPYKHKERWLEWRANVKNHIPDISKANSELILNYLDDMAEGKNVGKGCPKGQRKPSRLNDLKGKMIFFAKQFEQKFNISDLTQVTEDQLFRLLKEMSDGTIKKRNGQKFQDTKTFARDFKAFWNWHSKINRKKGVVIMDITEDLNTRPKEKSTFTFLKKREIKRLSDDIDFEHRAIIYFILDACIRPPTEVNNILVNDTTEYCEEVHIRDNIVKKGSFGRTNKLTFSSNLLREYIKRKNLNPEDYIFNINPASFNKYLRRHTKKLFGTGMTRGGKPYHKLTLYDFRHMACSYWSKILNKDVEIMERFGWKQSNKIRYYSNFIDDDEDEYDLVTYLSGSEFELGEKKKSQEIAQLREDVGNIQQQLGTVVNMLNTLFATGDIAKKGLGMIREDRLKREALERKRNALSTYNDTD